jgi:DNA-binding protein H-NS
MSKINVNGLNLKSLEKLKREVEDAIAENRKAELREKFAAEADAAGFALADIVKGRYAPKIKGNRPAKFVNPLNREQTWSGRGRRPKWYIELCEQSAKN